MKTQTKKPPDATNRRCSTSGGNNILTVSSWGQRSLINLCFNGGHKKALNQSWGDWGGACGGGGLKGQLADAKRCICWVCIRLPAAATAGRVTFHHSIIRTHEEQKPPLKYRGHPRMNTLLSVIEENRREESTAIPRLSRGGGGRSKNNPR